MTTLASSRVLLNTDAGDFAFRAGQLVERILLERGIEVARQADASVVTADHIESCIDGALLDQLRDRIGNCVHGDGRREQRKIA